MLIMYSRFHNYVAENLAAINEDGRFSLPRQDSSAFEAGLKKRDNDLFQTARLYVGNLKISNLHMDKLTLSLVVLSADYT